MDGGLRPQMPAELSPEDNTGDLSNGVIFEGSKGILIDNHAERPVLLPKTLMPEIDKVPETEKRVPEGHYVAWVEACMKGYGESELSSEFDYAGPLTEAVLMGNLAIRSYQLEAIESGNSSYPGRKRLLWDAENMKITNFDPANEFVMRKYREGWSLD